MGIGEIFKRGIEIVKASLPAVLVICVFNMLSAGVMLSIIGLNPTPEKIAEVTGGMMLVFMLMMLVWFLIEGGLFASILSVIKTGNIDMGAFGSGCLHFFMRILIVNILGGMVVILAWVAGAFLTGIFVAFGGGNNVFFNAIGGIVLLLTIICVAIISIPILFAQYFVVINDCGVKESFGKAISLFKQYFWKVILFFVVLAVCIFAISFFINFTGTLLGKVVRGWPAAIVSVLLTSLVNGGIGVFSCGAILTFILSCLPGEEGAQKEE